MTLADLVYEQVKALPDPLAREVLDFIGFLRERSERRQWRDLMNAQATGLAAVWDNAEDKVWVLTDRIVTLNASLVVKSFGRVSEQVVVAAVERFCARIGYPAPR
jgi:hypothetical protein